MKNVTVYTDGACSGNPGPGGWAAILIFNGQEKEISGSADNTTNNRMEITAVIEALSQLKEPCKVDLYSDSTYVTNAFNNGWIYKWKKNDWKAEGGKRLNWDLWEKLYDISSVHEVIWNHVAGHADNDYNNRCDKLAVSMYKNRDKDAELPLADTEEIEKKIVNEIDNSENLFEKTVRKEVKFTGRVFDLEVLDVILPDGRMTTREVIRHNGGAAVVPVDNEGNVYMVSQYRTAAMQVMLEIPAGKIEKKEDPLDCAKRELEEETGMKAEKFELLTSYYSTPGYCSEKIYIYLATGLSKGVVNPDDEEFLSVKKYPLDTLLEMICKGEISDGKTVAGILMAKHIKGCR